MITHSPLPSKNSWSFSGITFKMPGSAPEFVADEELSRTALSDLFLGFLLGYFLTIAISPAQRGSNVM